MGGFVLTENTIQTSKPRLPSATIMREMRPVVALQHNRVFGHYAVAREGESGQGRSLSPSPRVSLLRTTLPWEDRGFPPVRPTIEKSPPNRAFSIHDLVLRGRLEPGKFTEFSSEIRRKVII